MPELTALVLASRWMGVLTT